MSKWDEEFDFEDLEVNPTSKKGKDSKKPKKQEDDFFDLDDDVPSKASKLPTITKKQPQTSLTKDKNPKKSNNVYDDYEEIFQEVEEVKSPLKNASKVPAQESNYYQEIQDFTKPEPKNNKVKPAVPTPKEQEVQEFYESVQEIKPPVREIKKMSPTSPKKVPAAPLFKPEKKESDVEDYEQHFDDYGQDFEEEIKQGKHSPKKLQPNANLKSKDKNSRQNSAEKKKYAINSNQVFTNKVEKETKMQPNVPKPPQSQSRQASKKTIETKAAPLHGLSQPPKPIQRSSSRKSLKSNDSRVGNSSRVTKKYMTEFPSNKHMLMVEKKFPEDESKLNSLTIEKLSRLNENVRDMVRKFNEELNELINKNMILLKDKPQEKERGIDEKVKVLEEQLKSGATALEVIENEFQRLKGREGELKEEQYLLILQKKMDQVKEQSRETSKIITKLRYEVNNQGNKLSRQQVQKKMAQELHQIKTMLIQAKKQQQKYESKLQKLEKMEDELQGKNNDKQYELSEQLDAAKEKGIVINVKEALVKKYQELKTKVTNSQNHGKVLEALIKNKCEVINHEKEQIKVGIRNIESQVKNVMHSIEFSQEQSSKIIIKAKQNPKISQQMIENLDKLLKSIEENQNNSYFDVRSEGNRSQASERPLKQSMYQNIHKEKPSRNSVSKKDLPPKPKEPQQDQINLMKPNFSKKKEKTTTKTEEEDTNKLYEEVWKEDEEAKRRQEEKRKEEARKKEQEEKRKIAEAEESKKKPFTLKKNRLNNNDKSFEQTPETKKTEESPATKLESPVVKEQEQKSTNKPKFTRFNRRGNQNKNQISTQQTPAIVSEESKKNIQVPQIVPAQKDEEAPIFVPKRFNLRNKIEKKEDSYIPSMDKAEEKKVSPEKQSSPVISNPPKIAVKEEQPYNPIRLESKKGDNQLKAEEAEEKPRFALRLKDRQKKEVVENNDYVPTRITEVDPSPKDKNVGGYSPSSKQNRKEDSYVPTFKRAEKQNIVSPKESKNDPTPFQPVNNPYAPKQPVSNPYASSEEKPPVNNPYAQREQGPKKEREGPVKKIKIQNKAPKQKFNIYQQAQDLTQHAVQPLNIPTNEPVNQKPVYNVNLAKTDELDLNQMLGIRKQKKPNDLDDLLGEAKVEKKKERKKNTDFFNDLDL